MLAKRSKPKSGALALSPEKAAESIGLSPPSLDKDRREGHLGIPFVKAGRRVIYSLADLQDWLIENRVEPKASSPSVMDLRNGDTK